MQRYTEHSSHPIMFIELEVTEQTQHDGPYGH